MDQHKIGIMIVDDHDMLRSGLKVFLESLDDMELVAEASNGEAAIILCEKTNPDVVLIDLKMPRMDGITTIQHIRANQPHIQFIVLTSFVDEDSVQSALKAGAAGYLLKDASVDDLHNAINRAYLGKTVLSPEATQALVSATTRPPTIGFDLTEREIHILELIVKGLSNSEIGEQLHISRSTVKNHISSIFSKLNTDTRTETAALAIRHGIVKLPNANNYEE
jgi:two-component system, NarL family, response regulator LiaR